MKRRSISSLPVSFLLFGIFAIILVLYTSFVTLPFLQGPSISVNPVITTENGSLVISGTALRVSTLTINDQDTPLSEQGQFLIERSFPSGYTVVVLRAQDRFGRSREETVTFITKEKIQNHASEKEDSENGPSNKETSQ